MFAFFNKVARPKLRDCWVKAAVMVHITALMVTYRVQPKLVLITT